jgi:hypothetical protein
MPIYCGIDQALSTSGIALTDGQNIVTTYYQTDPKDSTYNRISEVREIVNRVCEYSVDTIAIEQAPITNQGRGKGIRIGTSVLITLNQLEFCLLDYFKQKDYSFKLLSARSNVQTSWTRILGSGGTKVKMKEWLEAKGIELPSGISLDEIDAIGICWASLVIDGILQPDDIKNAKITRVPPRIFRESPDSLTSLLQPSRNI